MALLDEVTHSPGIAVDVSTGKALVGHVEEHQQVPFLRGDKEEWRTKETGSDTDSQLIIFQLITAKLKYSTYRFITAAFRG